MYQCKFCSKKFRNRNVYANHIRWNHKASPYRSEESRKLESHRKMRIKEIVPCTKCGKDTHKDNISKRDNSQKGD